MQFEENRIIWKMFMSNNDHVIKISNVVRKKKKIKEIAKALLLFHSKVQKIAKSEDNPFFKSKYADLPAVLESIQQPLQESGLCFVQFPEENSLTTLLMHAESGEYMQATYNLHAEKITPQGLGSAITYARRYALGAILGLNTDKDDDGNKASESKPQKKQKEEPAEYLIPGSNTNTIKVEHFNAIQKLGHKDAILANEINKVLEKESTAVKNYFYLVCKSKALTYNKENGVYEVLEPTVSTITQ